MLYQARASGQTCPQSLGLTYQEYLLQDQRENFRQIVRELETRLRALASFGVRLVEQPKQEQEQSTVTTTQALDQKPVMTAGQSDYRFGDGRRAKLEQAAKLQGVEEPQLPIEPGSQTRKQTGLFGASEPQAEPGQTGWQPNPLSPSEAQSKLDILREEIGDCSRCRLAEQRTKIVFGEGNPVARLVFAGEGPGRDEDRSGRPFVGRAGQLLDRIIAAMGFEREEVYICNVVKCRPPDNRTPQDDEMRTCGLFLTKQLETMRPQFIVALGATAAKYLIGTERPMGKLRGHFFEHPSGARIMPTYHPAYLLRNPAAKKMVWDDVQKVMAKLARPVEEV
jgi:uracil-DNA glycosylase family 4